MNAAVLLILVVSLLGAYSYASPCGGSSQNELPARINGECDVTYYKRIFPIDSSCGCEKTLNTFYENMFYKYEGETKDEYVKRIDIIFTEVYPNIDCRADSSKKEYLENYYICKFGKKKGENDEEYFNRTLKKNTQGKSEYRNKIELIKRFIKHVDWSKVNIEENTTKGFSIIKKKKFDDSNACEKSEKKHYRNEEHLSNLKDIDEHNKRHTENLIIANRQKEEHGKNVMELNAKKQSHLENEKKIKLQQLEHNKNVDIIEERQKVHNQNVQKVEARQLEHEENLKKWIKANYKRKSGESIESFYKRICTKDCTSDEEYVHRLNVARSLFCDLDLWYNVNYLSEIKNYYKLEFSRKKTETDQAYFSRLVRRENYESEENCARRINILQKLFPTLSLWYEEKFYEEYTYNFYQNCYKREEYEQDEEYLKRVFTKLYGENEENFWKRIKLIKKTFPRYSCWYEKNIFKKLDACESVKLAKNVQDLQDLIKSEITSEECRKTKIECLKSFFQSSKSPSCSCK